MKESYLQYIRRQNPVVEGAGVSDPVRATIIGGYDFALKECGTDRASGEIWQDYIQFLGTPRVSLARISEFCANLQPTNEWEEQQKQDSLRKAYHRAVCIPLDNVEALWKAYDAFENNVNKQTVSCFGLTSRIDADK
jgi:cleavage stimulation factor subunit 3